MTDNLTPERRIARYVENNPNATVTETLGALGLDPTEYHDTAEAALNPGDPDISTNSTQSPDSMGVMGQSNRSNPTPDADTSGSAPSYRELYLAARERADADRAYVPHEVLDAVFRAHGWGDLVDHLRHLDDWLVWTPDNRETPLYAYTPGLAGDTSDQRARLAELFAETDLGTERFIDVHDGQKGSFDTGNARPPEDPEIHGNYGVKGGRGGDDTAPWLVDLDVDDYDTAKDATNAVTDLRDRTLAVASAHTTVDRPGHLYVAVNGDPRAVVRDLLGRAVDNPQASFGEIRVDQQYVVGPGSEVVCGCDRCTDGGDQFGRYELANDRPPVVWTENEFREFLLSDPKIAAEADRADERDSDQRHDTPLNDDADARLKVAKQADEYVAGALRDARNPDDRSAADAALARSVAPWLNYDERAITQVLDRHGTSKWATRTDDSYRDSVLNYAGDRAVDAYDPMPYWALVEFAVTEGLVDENDLVKRDSGTGDVVEDPDQFDGDTYRALPSAEAFNQALDAVEDYDVDHGRGRARNGQETDAEPVAVLPPAVRDLSRAASGWDWKHAARDDDTLTVDAARKRTVDAIAEAYSRSDRTLVEALPTMGKSYGAVLAAARTGEPITFLTGRGHKEQYDQVREWCDEHGLTYYTLPSFTRDCDTANGEHGEDWKATVRDWYHRGATPQEIHKSAEYTLGRPLPCQEHDGHSCPYAAFWDFDPDEYDVLIGHYNHAHKSKVTAGRTVVFDEFPDAFETTLGPEHQGAVSYWLETTPGVPFDSYTDLVEHRDDQERRGEALLWFDDHGVDPDETDVFDDASAHADAPLFVFTLLAGDDLGNGFERATLDDGALGVFDRTNGEVSLLQPPDLTYTSGVVALDGTPTPEMWDLALDERLNHRPVLQPDERAEYITDALNLNLVRTTEYVKPYNSSDHVNTDADAALLETIAEQHGDPPDLITTTAAEHEYDAADVLNLVDETKHYGNVLGSNEFDDSRLGAVIGSNHYGDRYIKKWGAYAGEAVERDAVDDDNPAKGVNLTYGAFGDKVHRHMTEHDTLQAAMRFGRDGNGAVVYVHTDTLPDWVPLAGEGRVLKTWSDGRQQVLAALEDLGAATTEAVVEHPAVDLSRQQVFDHLERLRDRDVLDRHQDPDDGRRVVWVDDGVHRVTDHGEVDLDPVDLEDLNDAEVRQLARSSIYTWEFTNRPGGSDGPVGPPGGDVVRTGQTPPTEEDPPPEPAD